MRLESVAEYESSFSIAAKAIEFCWEAFSETGRPFRDHDVPHVLFDCLSISTNNESHLVSICGSMAKAKWTNEVQTLRFEGWHRLAIDDHEVALFQQCRYWKGDGFVALMGSKPVPWTSLDRRTFVGWDGHTAHGLLFVI